MFLVASGTLYMACHESLVFIHITFEPSTNYIIFRSLIFGLFVVYFCHCGISRISLSAKGVRAVFETKSCKNSVVPEANGIK